MAKAKKSDDKKFMEAVFSVWAFIGLVLVNIGVGLYLSSNLVHFLVGVGILQIAQPLSGFLLISED
jgi:uncharacterized membrane protein